MKSFISIRNDEGRGIGVMFLMVIKHKKCLLQVKIRINERQYNILMTFDLLKVRIMGVDHVIK